MNFGAHLSTRLGQNPSIFFVRWALSKGPVSRVVFVFPQRVQVLAWCIPGSYILTLGSRCDTRALLGPWSWKKLMISHINTRAPYSTPFQAVGALPDNALKPTSCDNRYTRRACQSQSWVEHAP